MVKTNHKNLISKRLIKYIDEFIIDILNHEYLRWRDKERKEKALDVINILFDELVNDHKEVEQFKIVSDKRNNPESDFNRGIYHLEIQFVQSQCLTKTKLHYIFGSGLYKN